MVIEASDPVLGDVDAVLVSEEHADAVLPPPGGAPDFQVLSLP